MRLRVTIVVALFASLSFARPCGADDLPTVAALLAKVDAATGKRPDSSYETLAYTEFTGSGTVTTVRSGDDYRETDVFGPLRTARGVYHKQRWYQNANGQTVLAQPDPGKAVAEQYVATVGRVSAPIDAYVISRLNSAGSGTKTYVDPQTFHVIRRETIMPTETTVVTYDDFRTVAGYTTPYHWTRRDGHRENDMEYRITNYEARPVADSDVNILRPRKLLVEFPAGTSEVALPVQLVRNKFVVRVTINGRGLDFELDSGASGIAIEEGVAQQLGFKAIEQFSNPANAGRFKEATIVVPQMSVGDITMHDVAMSTLPSLDEEGDGIKVVGLLGFDFIAEHALRLDYDNGTVTAFDDAPAVPADAIVLDVRVGDGTPMTDVTINGALGERFLIDTGAAGTLMISDYFARRYPNALVDRRGGAGRYLRFEGVGGDIAVKPYQIASVKLGTVEFQDFVAYRLTDRRTYEGSDDGLIGATMLRYFTVWLDYADSRIVLVPNETGKRAMRR